MPAGGKRLDPSKLTPKIIGADYELGCFFERSADKPSEEPAETLLAEIDGVPAFNRLLIGGKQQSHSETAIDRSRRYLPNGGCYYIDSSHPEAAFPELRSARDFCVAHRDMLSIAIEAAGQVNARRRHGNRLRLLTANSDGKSHSWGTHLNVLLSDVAWKNITARRPHYQGFIASFHAAGVIFGQGKAGAENRTKPANFQLAQRTDFFSSRLMSLDTMVNRGIINLRAEPLCADRKDLARYHCIIYDHTLSGYANFLKVGHLQLVLLMVEAEFVPHHLVLEDPVQAMHIWGRDPGLEARARLVGGERITLAEFHTRLVEAARRFYSIDPELVESLVPEAGLILEAWDDTAAALRKRDFSWLRHRFDAWAKLGLIEEAMRQDPSLTWESPELKVLDHHYGELPDGLFFRLERTGHFAPIPGPPKSRESESIERHSAMQAPRDTRAGVRTRLLSLIPRNQVWTVDWDEIWFTHHGRMLQILLPDPAQGFPPEMASIDSLDRLVTYLEGGQAEFPFEEPEVSPAPAKSSPVIIFPTAQPRAIAHPSTLQWESGQPLDTKPDPEPQS